MLGVNGSATALEVCLGDITTMAVDAIVNAANSSLMGGGGVDGAIHRAGGPSILDDCRAIVDRRGPCRTGEAVVTGAGELPAGLVIHTVGPVWSEERARDHDHALTSCYGRCLDLATEHHVRSIAFPNISTGVYGFPKRRAARVAIDATIGWLEGRDEHPIETVHFVCFDDENLELYRSLLER
jgi:O-acetyl-ADP-ribose deacetylase (regulator of RNase III)